MSQTKQSDKASDPSILDLRIVEAYVDMIREEQRGTSKAYLQQITKLEGGTSRRPSAGTSRPTSARTPNSPFTTQDSRQTGGWSDVPRTPGGCDPLQVSKQCTAIFLDVFKELESMRSMMKQLFDHAPELEEVSKRVQNSQAALLRATVASTDDDSDPSIFSPMQIIEDMYASSSRAVESVRSGVVYTSTVLNTIVRAKEPQDIVVRILKLMKEETSQELKTHKDAVCRAKEAMDACGIRHLCDGAQYLNQVPKDGPHVMSWQASVLPPTPPTLLANTNSGGGGFPRSPRQVPIEEASGVVTVPQQQLGGGVTALRHQYPPAAAELMKKAAAYERVMDHSRRLCDELKIDVGATAVAAPIPAAPAVEHSSQRQRPNSSKRRPLGSASARPQPSSAVALDPSVGLGVSGNRLHLQSANLGTDKR